MLLLRAGFCKTGHLLEYAVQKNNRCIIDPQKWERYTEILLTTHSAMLNSGANDISESSAYEADLEKNIDKAKKLLKWDARPISNRRIKMKIIWPVFFVCFTSYNSFAQETWPDCSNRNIEIDIAKSDVVVVGEVKNSNFTLGYWSEGTLSEKATEYTIVNVIKGEIETESFSVLFPLLRDHRWVDSDRPRLSSVLFQPRKKHLLLLRVNNYPSKPLDKANMEVVKSNNWYILTSECNGLIDVQ